MKKKKKHLAKKKIILGGAQFGMPYGISRKNNRINRNEKYRILSFAHKNGINSIDLAQTYGKSEEIVGNYLKNNVNQFKTWY